MQEYVCDLQITVDHVLLRQVKQSLEDVLDDGLGPILIEVLLFPQPRLEVPFVAELSDDVAVAVAGEHLVALEHIGMVELLQHVNLREEQFLKLLALEGF